jgi:brefeldin A-resistance guanine nucleotide exchange factor 1
MATTDLPPITLLLQEVQLLTSAMRRNQRWATGSSQQFSTSQPPLPPYLHASKKRRSPSVAQAGTVGAGLGTGVSAPRRSRGGEREQGEEGDLMVGFIELRRLLGEARGEWWLRGRAMGFEDKYQTSCGV